MGRFSTGLQAGLADLAGSPFSAIAQEAISNVAGAFHEPGSPEGRFDCPECDGSVLIRDVVEAACPHCRKELDLDGLGFPEVELNCPECDAAVAVRHTGEYECTFCRMAFVVESDCFRTIRDLCPICSLPYERTRKGPRICTRCGVEGESELLHARQIVQTLITISMLAKIAKVDDMVCSEEIQFVSGYLDSMELDSADKEYARSLFTLVRDDEASIHEYAAHFSRLSSIAERQLVYALLWECAMADDELHESESRTLRELLSSLGLGPECYDAEYGKYFELGEGEISLHDLHAYYKILGGEFGESEKSLKVKRNELAAKFHPDKYSGSNVDQAVKDLINERMSQINSAWDLIRKHNGWS